ncbi:protease complex subunit PrcB family protein [Salegentibacter sp. LM13S]|uniref:protease complex subunit PrcB family protein n=1 Tax=Salegentibacter lacus TaxID=2873599 RepID=UPI001CCAC08F|nr:protease complex subunit PrcB family protein [Salegentibacter lacus]MBZ9632226.1 protease complex subunit PrcB family protein [Salegentibacter lacus]
MKRISILFTLLTITLLTSCSSSKITTVEFQRIDHKIVAEGNSSKANQKLLLVTYNKYFNKDNFGPEFIDKHKLDTINFRKNMLVEIFLGEKSQTGYEIIVDKIEENKDLVKIYYSVTEPDNPTDKPSQPYVIVQTHKSRKPAQFYENGEKVQMKPQNIYMN